MRFIKILCVFTLLIISKFASSQVIDVQTASFTLVPNDNGVILLNYNEPTSMWASFTVSRPMSDPWPTLPIKVEISLFISSNVPDQNIDLITITTSDWLSPHYAVSKVVAKGIVIPAGAVTLATPKTDLVVRYRYYRQGYPSPYNTDGWSDWMDIIRPMKLNPNKIPESKFIGPKQLCSEGIYTIMNPYTVSLDNASGIATLTSLGNNQWKVSRIGNAVGTVNLKSTFDGKVFNYPILVNSDMNGTIDGPVGIKQGWNDNYFYFTPEPGMDYDNVTWSVDSPHLITTQVDRYTFKISVPTNYPLMDKGNGDDVEIYIRSNGSCGVMEKSRTLRIIPARPIKN